MSNNSEYAAYSTDDLNKKINKFKKLQVMMTALAIIASLVIGIVSYTRNAPQGYQMIPILLVVGIGYPLLAFGGIRKKMQTELEQRSKA